MRGKMKLDLKKRIVKALIWSGVLYGSEIWNMTKNDMCRLAAFEMWIWRRILKISWTEHKTNDKVLNTVGEECSLVNTIRRRQKKWIGHTLRGDTLLRTVLEGRMKGKKTSGRPRIMLMDWMKDKDYGYREIKEKAENREEWKH